MKCHNIYSEVKCMFPMVVSMLPHAEFGGNDHREDAPHCISNNIYI